MLALSLVTPAAAQFSNDLILVEFVNGATIDEALYPFLMRDSGQMLRPMFLFDVRLTHSDGTVNVYQYTSGTPGVVQPPHDPSEFPNISNPTPFPIAFSCDITRIELGPIISVFVPVTLHGYELVETMEGLHYELRETIPPSFRELQADETDQDGNVILQRNIGVRDLPTPLVDPLCGTTVVFRVNGTLEVPTLAGVDQQPAYDRDDEITVAAIGGRYEFLTGVDAFGPDSGACCTSAGCAVLLPETCQLVSGSFQGVDTDCTVPTCYGACTHPLPPLTCGGSEGGGIIFIPDPCTDGLQVSCEGAGGRFHGLSSNCELVTGVCCLDYGCESDVGEIECAAAGGRFHGVGSDCGADAFNGLCSGSCCVFGDRCVDGYSECSCRLFFGGEFQGDGTRCGDVDNACQQPIGACCVGPSALGFVPCVETTAFGCSLMGLGLVGYRFLGDGTTCDSATCDAGCPGEGSCCRPHRSLGCSDAECCETVCSVDPWCCFVSWWDEVCADEARELCGVDCNHNGIADLCDRFDDCNGNGVPDECEPDCDGDGTPDDCEIGACSNGAPACDDCNLNGRPDSCDVVGMPPVSQDADHDGIPDECVSPTVSGVWSDDIWGLMGTNPYPDNQQGVPNQAVTVLGSELVLDVPATIDSLRLLNGATLDVTAPATASALDPDLRIVSSGALLIQGNSFGDNETLTTLRVSGSGRVIAEDGTVTVDTAGRYHATDESDPTTSASLQAGTLVVRSGCPDHFPGRVVFTGAMTARTTGDLIVDGSLGLGPNCECGPLVASAQVAGGETPPVVRVKGKSSVTVGRNLILKGNASLTVDPGGANLLLSGDLDNQVTCAPGPNPFAPTLSRFGSLILNGAERSQSLEAASPDLGPSPDGLTGDFAIDLLVVTGGSDTRWVDNRDNGNRRQGRREVQYIDRLVLENSATMTIDNCLVYARTKKMGPLSEIHEIGTGQLVCLSPGDLDCDADVDLRDYRRFVPCLSGPVGTVPHACLASDLSHDGKADLKDVAAFQRARGPVHCEKALDCNDGIYCNGDEACSAAQVCVPGIGPCSAGKTCNEPTRTCRVGLAPAFLLPATPVTTVSGETVVASFDCGSPSGVAQWRLFYLSSTDSRNVPADQLGTQLAIGSGNLGQYLWDSGTLAPGEYTLGISATDSVHSIAQTVAMGQSDRIVTQLGPIVRRVP